MTTEEPSAAASASSGFGKDTADSSNDLSEKNNHNKTPAEKIKEKAIEEERKEVADGSNGDTSKATTNGISTNPEEAHASDIKDNMSLKTDSANNTINGADDNASMLPLGKGGYSAPAMESDNTTGNATHATGALNNSTSEGAENHSAAHIQQSFPSSSTSVTRAEIDSAKQAIIRAVANCKLTREVVFSDTDTGTEDGSAEVKRVLSGYTGIDEALAEMNRYIPVHVRNSHDLGVKEGDRIQKEQNEAAKALEPASFGASRSASDNGPQDVTNDANATTATADDDSKAAAFEGISLQDMQPEAEHGITLGAGVIPGLPASTAEHTSTTRAAVDEKPSSAPTNATATSAYEASVAHGATSISSTDNEDKVEPTTTTARSFDDSTDNKDKGTDEAAILASTDIKPIDKTTEQDTGVVGGVSDTNEIPATTTSPDSKDKETDEAAILASTDLKPIDKTAEQDTGVVGGVSDTNEIPATTTSLDSKDKETDEAAILASTDINPIDKGKGRAENVGEERGLQDTTVDTSIATPPKSPVQGEKLSDRLKREVEERARRGQLGVFNKPLGSNASQANLGSVVASKEPDTAPTGTSKEGSAPASSAFTEEFGPGETGLTAPSSPTTTGVAGTTKPPSTRARTASLSSQTSTGEKRGLLGLFRRRSKRQSVSDGSTAPGARRASQDLGRTVSKDTISAPAVTASAVPPAPEKPVETIDTTAETEKDDKGSSKDLGLAALGVGAGTGAVTATSTARSETGKEEEAVIDKSTSTAEPSTSEHKVEDVAPSTEKATQTTHESAPALGTAAEPVVYAEETAPAGGDLKDGTTADTTAHQELTSEDNSTLPQKENSGDMLGAPAVAVLAAQEEDKEEPLHIEKHDSGDMIGPAAIAAALGEKATADAAETNERSLFKSENVDEAKVPAATTGVPAGAPATFDKSTSTTAEKGTSTEEDEPAAAPAVIAAPPVTANAAQPTTADDDTPLYSSGNTTSPGLERRSSKGGFFGLFRRRSSRRSSSGPPQRSISESSKPTSAAAAVSLPTANHVTDVNDEKAVAKEEKDDAAALEAESAVKDEPLEEGETPYIHATDPEDPKSDAAKAVLARSETDKEIAAEAEAYSEATIHNYGALNTDELETVEEEMERGPEETVAEPGTFIDHEEHEEDEERETMQSGDDHHEGVVATTGEELPHEEGQAAQITEGTVPTSPTEHSGTSERVASPVVAATPAERLMQSSSERRKSRGSGFFSLFRSRTRKEKDHPAAQQQNEYSEIVRDMGVAPKNERSHSAVAVGTGGLERSKSNATARDSFVTPETTHLHSHVHDDEAEGQAEGEEYEHAEEEEYVEPEEEIPDNRSITEIAASIPLPAPVYTEKTRAKHERIRKKREHEEAVERERIRKENELLNKRERILNAYTGKQDFTKVPKPARTKNFGRAHERKDLDGVQFINKSDKKAAKKEDTLVRSASRGSSINEPSSPSHPASGGFAGSFPVDQSTSRVSHTTHGTSGHDTEPGSPSSPVMVSPVVKLARRVSAITHKREKSVEPVPA